jgi:predicted dehydrogenase
MSASKGQNICRVGVAGLGKMGMLHAAIFNSLPDSCLVAVADPESLPTSALATFNPNIRVFKNLETMLAKEKLDAIVITTPVADHVSMALSSLENGIAFFVEKPLAVSAEQADPLIRALRKKPIPHMVGFMTRFVDSFQKGKEILLSGALGVPHRVTATIYVSQLFKTGSGWRYDKTKSGGGVLLSQGSHLLDLLTWYLGPVKRVNAEILSVYSMGIEDFAHVFLEFESGLKGWMDSSWSVRFKRVVETTIEILGANGVLTITDDSVNLFLDKATGGWPAGRTKFRASDLYRGVTVDVAGPQYTREDESFIQAIQAKRFAAPDAFQALHVQKIVDAAYASSRTRGDAREILS